MLSESNFNDSLVHYKTMLRLVIILCDNNVFTKCIVFNQTVFKDLRSNDEKYL